MKRTARRKARYLLLLTSLLIMTLLLCGCRKRLTNNSEVTAVTTDESGYLSESYEYRRAELGLSVAEKPLINLARASDSEEEYDYDESYDGFEDYDPDAEEWDDLEELDTSDETDTTDTSTSSGTTTTTTTPSTSTSTGIRRPSTTTTTPTTTSVTVTLDPNGGTLTTKTLIVRKGSTYSYLPTPVYEGYIFQGWYTAKKKGSQVTNTTTVKTDKAHTLYARWKKDVKKKYTVTLDVNADGEEVKIDSTSIKIEEGGTYEALPIPERVGYTFKGWYTKASGGKKVSSGDAFTLNKKQTLYAHWKYDPYAWWDNQFKTTANMQSIKPDCYLYSAGSAKTSLVEECKGNISNGSITPQYVIMFDDENTAVQIDDVNKTFGSGVTILIVPKAAVEGTDNQKLLYKLLLFDTIYGGALGQDNIYKAASDLKETTYTPIDVRLSEGVPVEPIDSGSGADGQNSSENQNTPVQNNGAGASDTSVTPQ